MATQTLETFERSLTVKLTTDVKFRPEDLEHSYWKDNVRWVISHCEITDKGLNLKLS